MNWSDERYVRVYTRDTTSWLMWSWQARCLFVLLLRKADRGGVIDLAGHGKKGIVAHVSMPWDVAGPALEELLEDGCISFEERNETSTARNAAQLIVRNYVTAQGAVASPKMRQQAWRERNETSTARNAPSPNVDAERRNVTSGNADGGAETPIRSVPNQTSGSGARACARDQVIGPGPEPEAGASTPRPVAAGSSSPIAAAPRPAPSWNGAAAVSSGSVTNRPNRCAKCGKGPPLMEDRGRLLCMTCMYPNAPELFAPEEAS